MRRNPITQLKVTVVLAIFAAAAATSCGKSASPTQPTSPSAASATGPGGAVEGDPDLGPELAAVRRATAPFHNVATAIAAGYTDPTGRICDQISIGTMGIHSPNPPLLQSQVLDPEHPEVLLYLPKESGGFRLTGVEYIQPVLVRNTATGAVGPWLPETPWPSSYQVVTPTPQLFGQTFQGPMPGHIPGMPWHWDLHVWIWANNPSGTFAQWNPSLDCPAE
ncbi:MAG TPA: hypothetical protein VFJ02_07310 [Vicinamibacterales bacterium]|nr:hypothetical protein [Vicinamibacterales bacterium]